MNINKENRMQIDKAGQFLAQFNRNYILTCDDEQNVNGIFVKLDCNIDADSRLCGKIQSLIDKHRKDNG